MKKVFRNISVIFMALLVLLSTISFTLEMHYCGDTLVDVALFQKAKTCAMQQQTIDAITCSMAKKSCCTDKELSFEGQDELKISFDKIAIEQQLFLASFYYSYINLFQGYEDKAVFTQEYPPPLLVRDIYILNETFLI